MTAPSLSPLPPPGDTRLKYTVEVKVLEEGDPHEGSGGNDELGRAVVVTLGGAPEATTSFTGRLGSVPDKDWYAVEVPTSSVDTVLHYL